MSDARPPIRLVFLWHFHQPDYTDDSTGAPYLPWTRLHALKDYADMAERLARHPRVRATINVVPSLLDQLRRLSDPSAKPDPFLEVARRPAASLSAEDRRFVVANFFSFNKDTLAVGLRRVTELAALRGDYGRAEIPQSIVDRFDDAALRDLQVLFHLVWCGPLLQADPRVKRLRNKGHGFTEEEKQQLLALQQEFVAGVVPRWKRLFDGGQVEFSVSPYFHPILPLLCDLESAHEALPGMHLPKVAFRHPEDADQQLARGQGEFEREFGRRAAGGWPPEGAISEASLSRMGAAGYRWAASDEDVLFASLGAALPTDEAAAEVRRGMLLYRPWRHADGPVLLFRDHDLSDRIGFKYSAWPPKSAADDFLRRLNHLRDVLPPDDGPYTVSVILDGENAWEYYPENAQPFFDALYGSLEAEPSVTTLTVSEAAEPGAARTLARVVAGSWIFRNFATWVGHPEKNRAWEFLAETRRAVEGARGAADWEDPAWRALFAAEGSDWFWWYGDDHPTDFAEEFDISFRRRLRAAWSAAGLDPPGVLNDSIRRTTVRGITAPAGPVRPVLDGRVTDYYEWLSAGTAEGISGAMQSSARLARRIRFGTDGSSLYLLIDPYRSPAASSLAGAELIVRVPGSPERTQRVKLSSPSEQASSVLRVAVDRVVEASIPLEALTPRGVPLRFVVEVETGEGVAQRIPAEGSLLLPAPEEDRSRFDWFV